MWSVVVPNSRSLRKFSTGVGFSVLYSRSRFRLRGIGTAILPVVASYVFSVLRFSFSGFWLVFRVNIAFQNFNFNSLRFSWSLRIWILTFPACPPLDPCGCWKQRHGSFQFNSSFYVLCSFMQHLASIFTFMIFLTIYWGIPCIPKYLCRVSTEVPVSPTCPPLDSWTK